MPHVDLLAEMEKRKGSPLTAREKEHLESRARSARFWLQSFAREEERITLQATLPARAGELTATQRAFLHHLAAAVGPAGGDPQTSGVAEWKDDALQAAVFDTARRTPVAQSVAFQAVYRVFLDRPQGPPAGALMAVLPRDMVLKRLTELPYDTAAFWKETATTRAQVAAAIEKEKAKIAAVTATLFNDEHADRAEIQVTHADGKVYAHRVIGDEARETVEELGLSIYRSM